MVNEALERANNNRNSAREKKKKIGFQGKESELQKMCESYLKQNGLRYVHIPDNVLRYIKTTAPIWITTQLSKAFKGVPDLMVFQGDKSLLVELKNVKGKLSQGQINWHKGVDVKVVRDFDTFKRLVDETFL